MKREVRERRVVGTLRALRRTIFLLGMTGAAGASSEAWAQPGSSREDARSRYREAQRLMEAQRWREALSLLREVTKAAETASVLYSIALCEENLGLWREALED
ncbi:MAG: hypothetical protein MUC96_36330 [Myxococcaceae bacterium]|nr:hypothetical protein [Myxococcaceae bacterium]